MTANYKLVYHGNKANLPAVRDAGSFYLTDDTRELYFGDKKYGEGVRLYTSAEGKPATPAEGVIYVNTDTGVGEVYNGSAWVVVIKGYATAIGENADDSTVPTSKAVKDYTDTKVAEVAGIVDGLGALAKKDEVSETELEATLKAKINDKAEQTDLDTANGKLTTLIGADAGKSARTIANEELAAQLIPESAKESLNTLAEIAAWIQSHPDDASAMNQAITALQNLVGTLPEGAVSDTVVAYIKEYTDGAIAALNIGDYAKAADLTAAIGRIAALEKDTHTHANKALLDTYDQTNEDLKDAVAKKHSHANKTELDKIVEGDKAKWDAAAAKAHEHANKTELDKIVEGDKAKWDAAAAKAHEHANKTELDKIAEGDKANLDAVVAALTVGTF